MVYGLWIVSIILLIVIALMILWIYYSGGGTLRTKELKDEIEGLEEENQALRETNSALRSALSSTSEELTRPVGKASGLVKELVRVKEALKGSKSAEAAIKDEHDKEISPDLVQDILSEESGISSPLKRRLAHEVLVGDIGKDLLQGLDEGKSLSNAAADAGVSPRVGRERVRLLKETGYLDNRLNLTDWGAEVLEL